MSLCKFLHNLLDVLVQITNKMGLQKIFFYADLVSKLWVWKRNDSVKPPEPQPSTSAGLKAKQPPVSDNVFLLLAHPPLSPTVS
jgi:hypothetical protein